MEETFEQYTARILSFATNGKPLDVLRATAPRLGTLIASRSDADLRWTPTPGRWSVAQILAHLSDTEVVLAYRIRMIVSAPGTPIQAFDQNAWAREMRYENRDCFASLEDEALDRFGVHAERGKESVRYLMRLNVGHDLNHLQQVERLLAERDRGREDARPLQPQPVKPIVSLETLQQLDIRVGTIRSVTDVAGTDRLVALVVDFADRQRTIVAGIRTERAAPSALVGQQALFVINLPPKTMRGQLSEGMLFDIGYEDGLRPALARPEWPVPDGTRAG